MATSKTLTPTNETIQIPAMTDAPDQSVNSNCIDKLGDAVNTLNSQLAAKIMPVIHDETITIPANGSIEITISRDTYTSANGYGLLTYVAILERATYGLITLKSIDTTSITFVIRNLNTSTAVETPCRIVAYFLKNN